MDSIANVEISKWINQILTIFQRDLHNYSQQ